MSNWDYVKKIPSTRDYRGQLSLVRHLRLQRVDGLPRLLSTPLAAQDTVFAQPIAGQDQTIAKGSDYIWPTGAASATCRIDFTLRRVGPSWPADISLTVRKGAGFETRFIFMPHNQTVSLQRDKSGPNAPNVNVWQRQRSVTCDFAKGSVTISLFIDSGSVELFINDGTATISELITAPLTATDIELQVSDVRVNLSGVSIMPFR